MSNVVKNVSYANGFELGTEFELRAIDKFVILFFFLRGAFGNQSCAY